MKFSPFCVISTIHGISIETILLASRQIRPSTSDDIISIVKMALSSSDECYTQSLKYRTTSLSRFSTSSPPALRNGNIPSFTIPSRPRSTSVLEKSVFCSSRRKFGSASSVMSNRKSTSEQLSFSWSGQDAFSGHRSSNMTEHKDSTGSRNLWTPSSSFRNSCDSFDSETRTLSFSDMPPINEVDPVLSSEDVDDIPKTEEAEKEKELGRVVSTVHRFRFTLHYDVCDKQVSLALRKIEPMAASPFGEKRRKNIITKIKLLTRQEDKVAKTVSGRTESLGGGLKVANKLVIDQVTPEELLHGRLTFSCFTKKVSICKKGYHLGDSEIDVCSQDVCPFANQTILANSGVRKLKLSSLIAVCFKMY